MEMFNTHRRDILNFDNYMDLKKPGFGGPNSAIAQRDAKGNKINKDPKLAGYARVVDRHPAFSHPIADPTYKAMTNDLVYKQEKKKPFNYNTVTGIPVVEVGETNEGLAHSSFSSFINEDAMGAEIDQLRADLEAYETENEEEAFGDDFGANPNGPAYRGPEGYDDASDSYVDDEFGANPADETRWQDSDGDGKWYEEGDDVSAGANPLDEEPPAELQSWLDSLNGEGGQEDPMADPMTGEEYSEFGANPFEDEEEYYGEEFDEPLYGPDEEDPNN